MRTYRESILKLALPDLDAGEETAPLVGELGHLSPDGLGQLVPVLTLPGHWEEEKVMIVSARSSYYRALCGLNGCIYSIRSGPLDTDTQDRTTLRLTVTIRGVSSLGL